MRRPHIIREGVDIDSVLDAIRNKYKVRIRYDDGMENNGGNPKGGRLIQPMAVGTTKAGRPVVRAFQESGGSRRGAPKWKFFRLDRITSWKPLRNKRFFSEPPYEYGEYNQYGDESMGTFIDNAKFDDFISPLDRERLRKANSVKVGKGGNKSGPVDAGQQWKRNVYTSQPNSKAYDMIRRNVDQTQRKDDDFWKLFDLDDAEREMTQNGPIDNNNDYDYDDVDYDEEDYINNNRRQ